MWRFVRWLLAPKSIKNLYRGFFTQAGEEYMEVHIDWNEVNELYRLLNLPMKFIYPSGDYHFIGVWLRDGYFGAILYKGKIIRYRLLKRRREASSPS